MHYELLTHNYFKIVNLLLWWWRWWLFLLLLSRLFQYLNISILDNENNVRQSFVPIDIVDNIKNQFKINK